VITISVNIFLIIYNLTLDLSEVKLYPQQRRINLKQVCCHFEQGTDADQIFETKDGSAATGPGSETPT
jgi:hypothetical protein